MEIDGLSPDQPIDINELGGKQSATPYAFHLIPPHAMFALAKVVAEGDTKYGRLNWKLIDTDSQIGHALQHIYAFLAGDKSDMHLSHAICRLCFALEIEITEGRARI